MRRTKKQAIANHRAQWQWHVENPEKQKYEYPEWEFNGGDIPDCSHDCFLCEYDDTHKRSYCGTNCLLVWPGNSGCAAGDTRCFTKWLDEEDLTKRAALAAQIRDLPERR